MFTAACWDLVVVRRTLCVRRVWLGNYVSLRIATEHAKDVQAAYSGRYAFTFVAVVHGEAEFIDEIAERRLWLDAERFLRVERPGSTAGGPMRAAQQFELFG
jgi:hypothetical protein